MFRTGYENRPPENHMDLETLKLLYLALGPGIAVAVYIYYADKWDPEPKWMALWSFLLGGLACFPTGYLEGVIETFFGLEEILEDEGYLPQKILYAFFGIALVEELCKFLFLKAFIYDHRVFNEPLDGIVYGGILGCGFATVENLFYVLPLGEETGVLRMFTAVPGHVFEGMILGYFMGRAKFSAVPQKFLSRGVATVVILHGLYDTAVVVHESWSLAMVFVMVLVGLYWGLLAKKELEKHSAVIQFSNQEYFLRKLDGLEGPLLPRDIRERLLQGKLKPSDVLVEKASGKTRTVTEIFSEKLITHYRALARVPSRGQSLPWFLLIYVLTFGLYFYIWFLKNYRRFRNYKIIRINPERRTLALFVLSTGPYFVLGVFPGIWQGAPVAVAIGVVLNVAVSACQAAFLYVQLNILRRFLKRKLSGTVRVLPVAAAYFVWDVLVRLLPATTPGYLSWVLLLIFLEAGVLARVQFDFNRYWHGEREGFGLRD